VGTQISRPYYTRPKITVSSHIDWVKVIDHRGAPDSALVDSNSTLNGCTQLVKSSTAPACVVVAEAKEIEFMVAEFRLEPLLSGDSAFQRYCAVPTSGAR
jgi:hypothetical protein